MIQAFFLFVLGVGGSILALTFICSFLSHVHRDRFEKSCQLNTYFHWILQKGTEEQRRVAEKLMKKHDLESLKALVGYSFLVDS